MEIVVFPAPGIVLARVANADPEETPVQYLLVGWTEGGDPIIARPNGTIGPLEADETVTDLVFQT